MKLVRGKADMALPKLLRIHEVAELTGLNQRTLRRHVYAGRLSALRFAAGQSSPLFVREADVAAFLAAGAENVRVTRTPRLEASG
jgi:excisionase family DNA binding protein